MIVDGKAIAEDITQSLRQKLCARGVRPTLSIISVAPNFATAKYLGIKVRVAEYIGITIDKTELPIETTTDEVIEILKSKTADGVVLQLPYPEHIDIGRVLEALPENVDVDAIGSSAVTAIKAGKGIVMPPVVAAIAHISKIHAVEFDEKRVVVLGNGRLVGQPASLWALSLGAEVTTLTKESDDIAGNIVSADILILGAGVSGFVTKDMVKDGVVIFDAGASEDAGRLVGDADAACIEKARLFTPVPGGIGPVAVAKLFENLLTLSSHE